MDEKKNLLKKEVQWAVSVTSIYRSMSSALFDLSYLWGLFENLNEVNRLAMMLKRKHKWIGNDVETGSTNWIGNGIEIGSTNWIGNDVKKGSTKCSFPAFIFSIFSDLI